MKKKISLFYWFLFLMFFLEIIYKTFAFDTLNSANTFSLIPFSLIFISFFSIITSFFKNERINKLLNLFILSFVTVYFIAQFVYYKFYIAMISLYSIKMGTVQVLGWSDQIVLVIFRNIFVVSLLCIPLILYLVYLRKYIDFKKIDSTKRLKLFIVLFLSIIVSLCCLLINKDKTYSNYNVFFNIHYPTLTVNKFGLTTTGLLDAYRFATDFKENIIYENNHVLNKTFNKDNYNILDIDFDKLIKEETDENTIKIHTYFQNKIPTNKNEYTGIFKGKNLVYITAESFDPIAIDKNLTPTLYKLSTNSFVFNNYYVPIFPVSTLDGEYMNLLSLIPKEGVWSLYESSKNYMPYGLGNVFSKLGYQANAYHNNKFDFYNRDLSHPNLGFNYMGCGNGLEKKMNCDLWPESDLELIESTLEDYINKPKFASYYMSVSGHLSYTSKNDMAKKNWDAVKDLEVSEDLKSYLAQSIELDKSLEYLINELEEKGILNDTLIVLAPDHYPYGFSVNDIEKYGHKRDSKFGLFKSSLIMYNPTIKTTTINKMINSLDILPTIYNLFGINYDSRLLMGNDIFSKEEGLVILADRSFKTSYLEYDALKDKLTSIKKNSGSDLEKLKKETYYKFSVSSKILETSYYEKLTDYID